MNTSQEQYSALADSKFELGKDVTRRIESTRRHELEKVIIIKKGRLIKRP
ncbi:hypothetical protein [Ohtaekwangia koreensis]|nr:hypothetical protein [Ohtaekwangia koreensis]